MFQDIWHSIVNIYTSLNRNGFPVPLIALIVLFMVLGRGKINWSTREKYYCEIILNLGIWEDSLLDMLNYYQEPGSEYRDDVITKGAHFQKLQQRSSKAHQALRDLKSVSAIFLSDKSNEALNELINTHWVIIEHEALNQDDYLNSTFKIVSKTHQLMLQSARADLKKSKFLALVESARDAAKS